MMVAGAYLWTQAGKISASSRRIAPMSLQNGIDPQGKPLQDYVWNYKKAPW